MQEYLQRSVTKVWKCKRTYSSVAWRMYRSARVPTAKHDVRICGCAWNARERTDILHHICVEVQMTLLSHPTPQPPHNVIFIVERKKWQQSRASQMPGTKNMSPKHHTYWLCIDIYIYAPTNMIHLWYIHIHIECIDIPNIFWALRSNQLTGENHQRPARNPGFLESLSSSALSSTHRPVNQGQPPS